MRDAGLLYEYFASARWTVAQISGRTDVVMRTAEEYVYTCFACIFGLIAMSVVIASVTNTMIELGSLKRERVEQIRQLLAYLRRHHVSPSLAMRVKVHFQAQLTQHQHEREPPVIRLLPKQILMDLLHEIRSPIITAHPLLHDLSTEFPRVVTRLCSEAVRPVLVQEEEVVFARGDSCMRMLFVERGILSYLLGSVSNDVNRKQSVRGRRRSIADYVGGPLSPASPSLPSPSSPELDVGDARTAAEAKSQKNKVGSVLRRVLAPSLEETPSFFSDAEELVKGGMWLSEAALWVQWDNHGTLMACTTGAMLELGVAEFLSVVTLSNDACARTVLYARCFFDHLAALERVSDILHSQFARGYMPGDSSPRPDDSSPSRVR